MHPSKRARPLRTMSCHVVIMTLDGPRLDVVCCILASGSAGATLPVVSDGNSRAISRDGRGSCVFAGFRRAGWPGTDQRVAGLTRSRC